MRVLVTGSSGLIGSEAVSRFDALGHEVVGLDTNLRRELFGPDGDTLPNLERLRGTTRRFVHRDLDIRDREGVLKLFAAQPFDAVIHCAAQPSHERAKDIPFVDFDVNAGGTLNLLEATRLRAPRAVFILMSTNKVYGDAPNEMPLVERETRWDYARPEDVHGVSEDCRVDRSLHSLFGASKLAADVLTQEYGRYFGMNTGVFRGGCVSGPAQAGVEAHGFLSYLVRAAVAGTPYTVHGYKGKQVRDQIHSRDVVLAMECFVKNPRPGEVYNLGGGRENAASILECARLVENAAKRELRWTYSERHRAGDHLCYISDTRKLKSHYPDWSVRTSLPGLIEELVAGAA